jgi:S-adenosylmethionine:tRNA ribosyltransferase-isomerase
MKTSDFNFDLPPELIAQYPPERRGQSRLMVLDRLTKQYSHHMMDDLQELLCRPGLCTESGPPVLVFNNSKVRKARLVGFSLETGAKVEFLLLERKGSGEWGVGSGVAIRERRDFQDVFRQSELTNGSEQYPDTSNHTSYSPLPTPHSLLQPPLPTEWKVLVQRSKRRKPGSRYAFFDSNGVEIARAEISGGEGEYRFLTFNRPIDDAWLDKYGHIPLPPYIKRHDTAADSDRYQTVYAANSGSVAAPTAGLHFTGELLNRLAAAGIEPLFVTLHVGLGTFLPVRCLNIEEHVMHRETYLIDNDTANKIETAKASGRKIVAVGTTSARTLESAWVEGKLQRGEGGTSIFIYPGYRFNVVDALFTNFHTPESTLLMMVSAFAGREFILQSYAEAIRQKYRFFSYGDAMLIT